MRGWKTGLVYTDEKMKTFLPILLLLPVVAGAFLGGGLGVMAAVFLLCAAGAIRGLYRRNGRLWKPCLAAVVVMVAGAAVFYGFLVDSGM